MPTINPNFTEPQSPISSKAALALLRNLFYSQYICRDVLLPTTVQVLDLLFDANEQRGSPIPLSEFHNATVSESADLRQEYMVSL